MRLALRIMDYVMWREWKNVLFWKAIFSFFPTFLLLHQIGTVPFKEGLEGSSHLQRTGGEKGAGVVLLLFGTLPSSFIYVLPVALSRTEYL